MGKPANRALHGSRWSRDADPRGQNNPWVKFLTIGVLWLQKPQHMKTNIPTRQTKIPSRQGLTLHEIIADGLIHAAHVFDIADDERFVERVLCLAWVNATQLVHSNFWQAAALAKPLSESLEVGKAESEKLCHEIGLAICSSTGDPFAAIRDYYAGARQCRSLDRNDPDYSDRVRQLIGEAVLGGLFSRGVTAEAFRPLVAQRENTRNEQRVLSDRLVFWANNQGLPRFHPFMELCVERYENARERDLLCSAIARHMPAILEQDEPWSLAHWLTPGWKDGITAAKFAPDEVQQAINDLPEKKWEGLRWLFQYSVVSTATAAGKVDLPAAYRVYLERCDPHGFADAAVLTANSRWAAWSAYDFAFWMGVVAEFGATFEGGGTA